MVAKKYFLYPDNGTNGFFLAAPPVAPVAPPIPPIQPLPMQPGNLHPVIHPQLPPIPPLPGNPVYLHSLVHLPPTPVLPPGYIDPATNQLNEENNLGDVFEAEEDHGLEGEAACMPDGINNSASASEVRDAVEGEDTTDPQE